MDIVLQGEVQSFHHVVFVDECDHNLLILLKSLEHVESKLEGWLVVGQLGYSLGPQLNENSCQLKRVVQDVELEQLVQHGILLRLEDKLNEHRLLSWLQGDLVLEH